MWYGKVESRPKDDADWDKQKQWPRKLMAL